MTTDISSSTEPKSVAKQPTVCHLSHRSRRLPPNLVGFLPWFQTISAERVIVLSRDCNKLITLKMPRNKGRDKAVVSKRWPRANLQDRETTPTLSQFFPLQIFTIIVSYQ